MYIFQDGKTPISKEFENKFFISQEIDSDTLFWEIDEEQSSFNKGGVYQVWILGASTTPMVAFARHDWQIIIDNSVLEQDSYEQINVGGRTVELRIRDYRFVCTFPAISDQ
jgi:hypothetical protein